MTTRSDEVSATLTEAVSRLYAVGRDTGDVTNLGVQLHCLRAADLLRASGADPVQYQIESDGVEATIRGALIALATLPADVFGLTTVAEAASAARRALELHPKPTP